MTFCIALTTAPDTAIASQIAKVLVHRQLAACVKIMPHVNSVYVWEGEVVQAQEAQLVIKTTHAAVEEAFSAVREVHPYEVPEWIVINNVTMSEAYGQWLLDNTLTPPNDR